RASWRSLGRVAGCGRNRRQEGGGPGPQIRFGGGDARGGHLPRLGRRIPREGEARRGAGDGSQDQSSARAARPLPGTSGESRSARQAVRGGELVRAPDQGSHLDARLTLTKV